MNKPLISVIVPIYNIERYVGICIESIIKQTYQNLEIILVDDGSQDRSSEICDLYAKKDNRIKVIHKKNGGLVSARKAGIQVASGEYATYVDGDDWLEKGFYDWMVKELSDADVVIAGQSRTLFNKTVRITSNIPNGLYEGEELENFYKEMISFGEFFKPGITTYVWNKLFRKDLLLKYQMMVDNDISIGEDAAVVYPLLMECKKIVITDNCDYHYRQREDSMLKKSKPFSKEVKGLSKLYKFLIDFAGKQDKKHNIKDQVEDFILSLCLMRSGCIEDGNDLVLPFKKDFKGKRVAVYSAGTFGQQLVNRIKEHNYANVVAWVDEDYWEYRRCSMDVDDISSLSGKEFDYLLVATVNKEQANNISDSLSKEGLDKEKILVINSSYSNKTNLLKRYFN